MPFRTPLIMESVHQQGTQLAYAALYFAHLFLLIWPQVCSLVLWNLGQDCFIKPCGLRHLPPARRMILKAFQITVPVVIFSVLWTNTLLAWSLPQFQGNVCIYLHSLLKRGSPLCSFHALGSPPGWIHLLGSVLSPGEELGDQNHQLLVPHMVCSRHHHSPPCAHSVYTHESFLRTLLGASLSVTPLSPWPQWPLIPN